MRRSLACANQSVVDHNVRLDLFHIHGFKQTEGQLPVSPSQMENMVEAKLSTLCVRPLEGMAWNKLKAAGHCDSCPPVARAQEMLSWGTSPSGPSGPSGIGLPDSKSQDQRHCLATRHTLMPVPAKKFSESGASCASGMTWHTLKACRLQMGCS